MTIYSLKYSFPFLEPVHCSTSSSNCCFLTCIQISQEAGQVVLYSHLFQNFPQFIVIYTVKVRTFTEDNSPKDTGNNKTTQYCKVKHHNFTLLATISTFSDLLISRHGEMVSMMKEVFFFFFAFLFVCLKFLLWALAIVNTCSMFVEKN